MALVPRGARKKSLGIGTVVAVLFALMVPLSGGAHATHTTVDAEPENDRNAVGSQHTIVATTSNAGQELNFDVDGPGDPGGEPSDFECQTDAQAPFQCSYTYSSSAAGTDTITVFADEEGTADDDEFDAGEPNDQVQKVWVAAADIRVDCTPDTDTNPEGFTHTVTCSMSDAGGPVSGGQIDGEFLAGSPNDPGGNESGAPADVNDICDANESAAGTCSFTYTGNNPGNDDICFFVDEDANNDVDDADCATEAAQGGADDADDADVVRKTWERQARLDCTPETDKNPNGTNHQINCVFRDENGNAINLPEAQLIDFEIISGPNQNLTAGFRDFECPSNDPTTTNNCTGSYNDQQAFDESNATDVICAWISHDGDDDQYNPAGSPEDGGDCDTEAAGDVDNDETDVMTKTWLSGSDLARNIQLCHGGQAGANCVTANQENEPGDEHLLTARVTDHQGNPVNDVPVEFRETGPGIFTPQGGGTATVTTDANGLAAVLLTSDVEGTSTVVAEISPEGTQGGFRTPGANNDECERPAGTNNQPAAGNCTSQTHEDLAGAGRGVPVQRR